MDRKLPPALSPDLSYESEVASESPLTPELTPIDNGDTLWNLEQALLKGDASMLQNAVFETFSNAERLMSVFTQVSHSSFFFVIPVLITFFILSHRSQ
jgi:hypothetical protein